MQIPQFCSGDRNIAHEATRLSAPHYHAALVVSSYMVHRKPCRVISFRTLRNSPPAATTPKSRKVDRTILSRIGTVGVHSSVGRRRITTEAQVRSYCSTCDIYGGKSGNGIGFSRNNSACTANLHSTSTSYLFIYHPEDGQLA